MSVALLSIGYTKQQSTLVVVLSGLVEPIGGLLGGFVLMMVLATVIG